MTSRAPLAIRRFRLVAVVVPAIVVAVGVVVQLLVLPQLPDPVAIHWGADGSPDGFGPAWISIVLTVALGFGIPLLIAASALGGLRRGDRGVSYRLLGATALGMSVMIGALLTTTLVMQAGLTDAADGPTAFWALGGSFVVAVVAACIGWALQPDEPYRATALPPSADPHLSATERVVWLQRVSIARSGVLVLGSALALLVVMTIVLFFVEPDPTATIILGVVTIVMAAVIATTVAFHVRVDDAGLSVISVVGFPRVHVPLDEIESAAAVEVNPMGEFGGWGLRWAPAGGFGVVLRTGPGIRVVRTNGKVFTVTVDDAETGVALLDALRARAH